MRKLWKFEVCFLFVLLICSGITSAQENKPIKRWVTGIVAAVDTKAIPNTIVVDTTNWKGKELTVGAQVPGDTEITINGKPARLLSIKAGDKASMVYLREPTRLVARKINIERK